MLVRASLPVPDRHTNTSTERPATTRSLPAASLAGRLDQVVARTSVANKAGQRRRSARMSTPHPSPSESWRGNTTAAASRPHHPCVIPRSRNMPQVPCSFPVSVAGQAPGVPVCIIIIIIIIMAWGSINLQLAADEERAAANPGRDRVGVVKSRGGGGHRSGRRWHVAVPVCVCARARE